MSFDDESELLGCETCLALFEADRERLLAKITLANSFAQTIREHCVVERVPAWLNQALAQYDHSNTA